MFEIILYIGLCVAGYVVAVPLRSKRDQLGWVGTVQTIAVLALFSLRYVISLQSP